MCVWVTTTKNSLQSKNDYTSTTATIQCSLHSHYYYKVDGDAAAVTYPIGRPRGNPGVPLNTRRPTSYTYYFFIIIVKCIIRSVKYTCLMDIGYVFMHIQALRMYAMLSIIYVYYINNIFAIVQ